VDAGTLDTQRARVAAGKRLANGLDFALSASFERSGGMHELYFPAFDAPETNNGIAEGLDAERQSGVYGRISFKDLTVTGASGSRRKDVPTASFGALFNAHDPAENTTDVHSFIDALYDRPFGATRLSLRASWDRVTYAGTYPYASEDENLPVLILDDGSLGTRLTIDAKATRVLPGRQTLTVGAEFFDNFQQNLWLHYRDSDIPDEDINRSSRQGAVFAQDEIALRRWLLLTAGVRYDAFEAFSRVTPRGAVIVVPSSNQSFKYLYGKAFRAPNAYELYYFPLTRPDLAPESIDTHEIVWEQYVGEWLRTSVSTYFYEASQLISLAILDPDDSFEGLGFVNQGAVSARGLELEAEMRFKRGVRGQASYALQRATDEDLGTSLTNSPRHMAKVQLSVPGPLARSLASFELQYLSRRGTLAGATVAPQALAHVTLSAPISRSLDVVGTIRNLFDQRYADPASDEHQLDAIEQNGRTMNVGLRWKIGKP